jgi:LCP family protein required for cell wall assembly
MVAMPGGEDGRPGGGPPGDPPGGDRDAGPYDQYEQPPGPGLLEPGAGDIVAPRPGRYPPPANLPPPSTVRGGEAADGTDAQPPGRARGRRPAPSPAQQRLISRVTAGRRARRQRVLLVTCALISGLVLAVSGGAWALAGYVNHGVGRVDAGTAGTPPSGPLNILVAGVDQRTGLSPAQEAALHVGHVISANSDTMMLVHVNGSHTKVTVVSLPRDSWVDIPGHGMNKINAAYGLGGARLMVQTVEQATGVTINNYVQVNFLGFVSVIDALGGVDVCLPQPVDDAYSGLHMTAGRHRVDGITALKYARTRHSFAAQDLARITNQQQLLASLLHEAVSSGTLADPIRLTSFLRATLAAVSVDRGLNVAALADQMRGISPKNVAFVTVPIADANYLTPAGQSAVRWDASAAGRLFTAIRSDQPVTAPAHKAAAGRTGPVVVDIYNGTLIGGLSSYTGAQLTQLGFRVRDGLTWRQHDVSQTLIEYPPGRQATARQLGAVLPAATLRQQAGLGQIRIVLGVGGHELAAAASSAAAAGPGGSPAGQFGAKTADQNACR